METITYPYRFADAVLKDKAFAAAYEELINVLQSIQIPLCAAGKVKKRTRNKSSVQFFPVDQKTLNKLIEAEMGHRGWDIGPLVVPEAKDAPRTKIKSDFKKARIQVEVQFGNMARWYSDVFKFQLAYSRDSIDVGVLVVPTQRLANLIDENVASYERVERELPWAKMSLTLPILVIGVYPKDYKVIQKRYEEAAELFLKKKSKMKVRPFAESANEPARSEENEAD